MSASRRPREAGGREAVGTATPEIGTLCCRFRPKPKRRGSWNHNATRPAASWHLRPTVGAGVDYRPTKDISAGFETKYLISRGQSLTIDNGPKLGANLDSLVLWFGVRAYFATF
jgi:hypothetical protein